MEYKRFARKGIALMCDWVPEMDMTGVSIPEADLKNGCPKIGDMIAVNPKNPDDRWLIEEQYHKDNFTPIDEDSEHVGEVISGKVWAVRGYPDTVFDSNNNHVLQVRGRGSLSRRDDSEALFELKSKFIIDAINEKIEREQKT